MGTIKSAPRRANVRGHDPRNRPLNSEQLTLAFGFCHCGCGGGAPVAKQNHTVRGWVKGQPMRFIRGHGNRKHHTAEDRKAARLEDRRKWKVRNPEKVAEGNRQYRAENREKVRRAVRRSNANYPDRVRRRQREWREQNPGKVREQTLRRRRAPLDPEAATYAEALMADPCNYCGSRMNLELEHITPISRGGDSHWMNLATACRSCNAQKNASEPLEFLMRRST